MRLKAACEQRLNSSARANQNPLLEATVLYVLLHTGLRANELSSLNLDQYHHRGLHDVKRKGSRVSKKVSVPTEARELLDRYIDERRGREPGPLFLTRYGQRLTPLNIAHICERLAEQANVHVGAAEAMHLTPHMLRHTFLKRVADKHGVNVAQEMSGNRSIREIFRYTKPSESEVEATAESLFL
jgi:integrase/recombinase XerD